MSTKAQAVWEQVRTPPPTDLRAVGQGIQDWLRTSPPEADAAADPIRAARSMFAGSLLNEALLASRAEDNRRVLESTGGPVVALPS